MAKLARRLPRNNRRTSATIDQTNNAPQNIGTIFNFEDGLFHNSADTDLAREVNNPNNRLRNIQTPIEQLNKDLQNNQKWVRFVHVNARSVPGHITELTRLALESDSDVVGFGESFIKDDTPLHKCNIEGYNLFTENRTHTTQGGVGFFVKDNIPAKKIAVPKNINYPELICLELTIKGIKVAVICVYKSPALSYTSFSHIIEFLADINSKYENTITMGDFNVDQLDKTSSKYKYLFSNLIQPLSLKQIIEKPTRIDGASKTLIDLMLLNNPDNLKQWGVADIPGISDHHMIYMTYAVRKPKFKPKVITKRDFSNFSEEDYVNEVRNIQWDNIFTCRDDDIDEKVKIYEEKLLAIINKHAPFKTVRVTKPATPWLSSEIKSLMDYRDKLKTLCNLSNSTDDIAKFKEVRNQVSHAVKKAQKAHLSKTVDNNIKNSKVFFDQLKKNNIVGSKNNNTECKHSATYLNQTFLKNNNAKENIDLVNSEIQNILNDNNNLDPSFKFEDVSVSCVKKIIKSIKSKSAGVDDIGSSFVKLAADHLAKPLTHIINSSFKHRKFPERWKRAIVRPIPKTANPILPTDYRPISLLTVFSKITEKAAAFQVIEYLHKKSLQDRNQSAYKRNHSTTTALLKITDDIYNALDDGELTLLVLLDYSKAFDTINHRILFAKLKALGFTFDAVSWICGYLTDRKQKVKTQTDESGWESMQYGVPQGSVLGPLLFSLVVNDISTCIKYGNYAMYADDTQIYYHFKLNQLKETIAKANSDLNNVASYSERNCLKLNAGKSNYIIIGSQKKLKELKKETFEDIKIGGDKIARETQSKNLGVIFDEKFTWEQHISKQIKKAYSKLRLFYNLRKSLSIKTKIKLVETYVLSQLNYCDMVTQAITGALKTRIQRVQNSCIRYIFGLRKYDHISPFLKKLDTLKIEERTRSHALTLMHKIVKKIAPSYLIDKVSYRQDIHSHNTRNRNTINTRRLHIARNADTFFNKTVKDYNTLIQQGVCNMEDTVNSFKAKCTKHLKHIQS